MASRSNLRMPITLKGVNRLARPIPEFLVGKGSKVQGSKTKDNANYPELRQVVLRTAVSRERVAKMKPLFHTARGSHRTYRGENKWLITAPAS